MWHNRITLTLAVLAVLLLMISGPGTRADLWPFRVGLGMFAGALLVGLAAAGAAIVGLVLPLQRAHSGRLLIAALMLGAAGAAVPLDYVRRVKTLPYINDITTDTDRPPQFSSPKTYEGHFAEFQRRCYPNVRPLELPLRPKQAFARAAEAASICARNRASDAAMSVRMHTGLRNSLHECNGRRPSKWISENDTSPG